MSELSIDQYVSFTKENFHCERTPKTMVIMQPIVVVHLGGCPPSDKSIRYKHSTHGCSYTFYDFSPNGNVRGSMVALVVDCQES